MKNCVLFLLFVFSSFTHGRKEIKQGSQIEIKLKLLEEKKGARHDRSLSLSMVNTSGRDIYIPALGWQILGQVKIYVKDKDIYKEIGYSKNLTMPDEGMIPPEQLKNAIDDRYRQHHQDIYWPQDKIMRDYFANKPELSKNMPFIEQLPMFLKAGQTIADYPVVSLNHVFLDKGDFKIEFKYDKSKISALWPGDISGYSKVIPDSIVSNIIYYSTYE